MAGHRFSVQIWIVTAQQGRVGCSNVSAMAVDNNLQLVFLHPNNLFSDLLLRHQKHDGVDSELKFRTDSNEAAAHRFYQVLPAELQVQHLVVFIRLIEERQRITQQ